MGKIGKFGEVWAIRQYFTRQLFLLVILLATEVTKQLPFNLLNVSYSAYYSTSLPAILPAHTNTERFTQSFTKVAPINRINFCTMNPNHRRFNFTTRNVQTIMHASLHTFAMVTPNFHVPPKVFIYILLNRPSQLIHQYFTPPKFSHVW